LVEVVAVVIAEQLAPVDLAEEERRVMVQGQLELPDKEMLEVLAVRVQTAVVVVVELEVQAVEQMVVSDYKMIIVLVLMFITLVVVEVVVLVVMVVVVQNSLMLRLILAAAAAVLPLAKVVITEPVDLE
jgi:hypothetical protein